MQKSKDKIEPHSLRFELTGERLIAKRFCGLTSVDLGVRFMESLLSRLYTLHDREPRIAEFIPPQRRHVQEHRNNSNAFAHITLKRHECRAPAARFVGCPLSKNNTSCAHESLPGRAVLPHSLNVKAAQQRRPTKVATRFMESLLSRLYTLRDREPRFAEFIPPQGRQVQKHRNNSNAFAHITLKRHECRAPFARFMSNLFSIGIIFLVCLFASPINGADALQPGGGSEATVVNVQGLDTADDRHGNPPQLNLSLENDLIQADPDTERIRFAGDNAEGTLLSDGGFETTGINEQGIPANSNWRGSSKLFGRSLENDPDKAYSGDWCAWFTGAMGQDHSWLYQEVSLPSDGPLYLSFNLRIPESEVFGELRIFLGRHLIFEAKERDRADYQEYQPVTLNLSALVDGGTHRLMIESTIQEGDTSFLLDQFHLSPSQLNFTLKSASPVQLIKVDPFVQPTLEKERSIERLFAEFRRDTKRIQIIVQLDTDLPKIPANRKLADNEVEEQSHAIAQIQELFIQNVPDQTGTSIHRYKFIPFATLSVNLTQLRALKQNPFVRNVTLSREIEANQSAGGVSLRESAAQQKALSGVDVDVTGRGRAIAVLDSGFDANHPDLIGRIVSEACYSADRNPADNFRASLCPNGEDQQVGFGSATIEARNDVDLYHGTHVASIAAGMAPDAKIIAVNVNHLFEGANGQIGHSFELSNIIKGLERVYELRNAYEIASVNVSLGGGEHPGVCNPGSDDTVGVAMLKIASLLNNAGIAVIAASGNNGFTDAMHWPACVDPVISVGAVDSNNAVTGFSNVGRELDFYAPGKNIVAANLNWRADDLRLPFNGTSMAAPHVAGLWALIREAFPEESVIRIVRDLKATGVSISDNRTGGIHSGKSFIQLKDYFELVSTRVSPSEAPTRFRGIEFPLGDLSFADLVVGYDPGFGSGSVPRNADGLNPLAALWHPLETEPGDTSFSGEQEEFDTRFKQGFVSLGDGGRLTLKFLDNELSGSGTVQPDLYVFETGSQREDTFVEISKDGVEWSSVGKVSGGDAGIDIDAFGWGVADIFRFVRLTDDSNQGPQDGRFVGADIDAVGTILGRQDVTHPGDSIVAVSKEGYDLSHSPSGERVAKAIDDDDSTKYLNSTILDAGLIVSPSIGATFVSGLTFTSANDASERDPATYTLWGSNDAGATFEEIHSGVVPSFEGFRFRRVESNFANDRSFLTYKLLFPTVVDVDTSCCMQIAEVEFLGLSANGDWSALNLVLDNTPEAELMVRAGDIDNLNFEWPAGFDPFSGNSTPAHSFPWAIDPSDPLGTDRIMVISSYDGNPPAGFDGYTRDTQRPANQVEPVILEYDLGSLTVREARLQLFVDDFQPQRHQADYQVWLDDVRAPFLEPIINGLAQGGPIGKLITVQIPDQFLPMLADGNLSIRIDDLTTGAGDGYAIDFVKLLINPTGVAQTGTITGIVKNSDTGVPLASATVSAGGIAESQTDDQGRYALAEVPAGLVVVVAARAGYTSQTKTTDLVVGESATVDFELTPSPYPEINVQPISRTVATNDAVTFNVAATGTEPLSYQWQLNGQNISGATQPEYSIANAELSHAGVYTVVVSNSSGSMTSDPALLTVETPLTQVFVTPSVIGFGDVFVGEISSRSLTILNTGRASLNVKSVTSDLGDVLNLAETDFTVTPSSSHDLVLTLSPTIPGAIVGTLMVTGNTDDSPILIPITGNVLSQVIPNTPPVVSSILNQVIDENSSSPAIAFTISDNETSANELVLSATSSNIGLIPVGSIVFEGSTENRTVTIIPAENQTGAASINITVGDGNLSSSVSFNVEVQASEPVSVVDPPVITQQPISQEITEGDAVSFNISVTGTEPLQYQWQKDGADISAASEATFTLATVQPEDAGSYTVAVSNEAGSVTSSPAVLVVNAPPLAVEEIAVRHLPLDYAPGELFTVSIIVKPLSDTGAYAVEDQHPAGWLVSSINEQGSFDERNGKVKWGPFLDNEERNLSYDLTPTAIATGTARFAGIAALDGVNHVVTGSDEIAVRVTVPPVITQQPISLEVTEGDPVSFNVTATGTVPLQYQWRKDGADISAASEASYTLVTVQPEDAGSYTVAVSNEAGSVTSSPAVLVVNALPPIVEEIAVRHLPVDYTPGELFTVSIIVKPLSDTGAYAVEDHPPAGWSVSSINEQGSFDERNGKVKWGSFLDNNERTLTYELTPTATAAGIVRFAGIAALDGVNHVVSGTDSIAVRSTIPPVITQQPISQEITEGDPVSFNVVAVGTEPLKYQWRKATANIAGAIESGFAIDRAQLSDAGNYSVIVSNESGSVTSNDAVLTVNIRQTQISVTPSPLAFGEIIVGETVSKPLTVLNIGEADLTIVSITSDLGDLLKISATALSISPQSGGEITLELSPLAAGTITGNLTIAGNTPDSPITVPVQATVIVQEPPSELPKIAFRSEGKSLVIEWSGDGTLQVADGVTGPWTDVIGSSSPTIIENLDANKFYRIKQ